MTWPISTTLTVIDYSRPSTEKRLWVFDLHARTLLFEELVAHGRGSGENLATSFSNQPESHQTSLGLFRTEDTYVGRNGYSLRLRGLDGGFNDQAYARAIVMHGAPYVSDEIRPHAGASRPQLGLPGLARRDRPRGDRHGQGSAVSSSPTTRTPPGSPRRSTSATAHRRRHRRSRLSAGL